MTYEGTPGAGLPFTPATIRVTFTPDRSGAIRVTYGEGPFSAPLHGNGQMYFEPPSPVTGGAFSVGLPFDLTGTARAGLVVEGTFESDTQIVGRVRYLVCLPICQDLGEADLVLTGPLDTPPGPGDARLMGSLDGDEAGFALWLNPEGTGVTSIAFRGGALSPCIEADDSGTLHWFFQPPAVLSSENGQFSASTWLTSGVGLILITVDGSALDGATFTGTLACSDIYSPETSAELIWIAWPQGGVGGVAELADVAPFPEEAPSAGRRAGGDGTAFVWFIVPVAVAALTGAIVALRRRAGRSVRTKT